MTNQPNQQNQSVFGIGGNAMFDGEVKFIDYAHQNQQGLQANTLDEPVIDTVMRDLYMIANKIKFVMWPLSKDEQKTLRNWDLWGPLLITLSLSMTLGIKSVQGGAVIFGTIFFIMVVGSTIITLNAKLLGGKVSFFQSVCTLGYCVFPINVAAFIIAVLSGSIGFILRLAISGFAFFWSTRSSIAFMGSMMNENKKLISVYPIFLFYLFLAWFCIFV